MASCDADRIKKRKIDTKESIEIMSSVPSLDQIAKLSRHQESVWHVAWHPCKAVLATCGSDKTVCIWSMDPDDESSWSCTAILDEASSRTIRACEWSPDGKFLAAVSFDASVIIWVVSGNNFEPLATLEGHENEVKSVAWRPDGSMLATCSRDKSIWIWDADPEEFESICVLSAHSQDVKCVKWDPTGENLFSCSYDDTIKIWQEEEDEEFTCIQTLNGHASTVWSLSFSKGGNAMASCSDDCSIIIWTKTNQGNNSTPKWTQVKRLSGYHDRPILCIDWSSDEATLASGGEDDKICFFSSSQNDPNVSPEKMDITLFSDLCLSSLSFLFSRRRVLSWNSRRRMLTRET